MILDTKEIAAFAKAAGFTGLDLIAAVAVALAESSGDPNAHGDTTLGTGSGSIGLWQIYLDAHPEYGDGEALYSPQANAEAAFKIYTAARRQFTPWSTYKNGAFANYMRTAWQAVSSS